MILLFGLGNPGEKYKNTRHNIGFKVVDGLESLNLENVVLAKSKTFMNESGEAVKKLIKNLKLEIKNLIVIHDDLDLPLGKIKISKSRGSAGHKGVDSIIQKIGTNDFGRIRIGICPLNGSPENVEKFVLQKFNPEERIIMDKTIETVIEAVKIILEQGLEKAMNEFNI